MSGDAGKVLISTDVVNCFDNELKRFYENIDFLEKKVDQLLGSEPKEDQEEERVASDNFVCSLQQQVKSFDRFNSKFARLNNRLSDL